MAKCRTCGKYNDVFEWPEEDRPNYVPHLCYACYQEKLNQPEEDETPDAEDEFGMGEIKPNPDDDDSPIIPDDEEQSDNNEQDMEENQNDKSDPLPDEVSSIENIRRMLFG